MSQRILVIEDDESIGLAVRDELEFEGFDVILIETVGVGQSETTVRSMVDFFLLLMLSGAGDELQGIKKGVMELADALLINKADGDNKAKAEVAREEYNRALHYLLPATEGWTTQAYTCSSLTGDGIADIWPQDLDRDLLPGVKDTPIHLRYASRRHGLPIELGEDAVDSLGTDGFKAGTKLMKRCGGYMAA